MSTHKLIQDTQPSDMVVCAHYNMLGVADYVIGMQFSDRIITTTFKVPNDKVAAVWRKLGRDPLLCPYNPENKNEQNNRH